WWRTPCTAVPAPPGLIPSICRNSTRIRDVRDTLIGDGHHAPFGDARHIRGVPRAGGCRHRYSSPTGPGLAMEVNQMAEKKISPKAASSKSPKASTKAAATRVTKKAVHKKVLKRT